METPGTILKREREAQGLSLKEISAITRIPSRSLQHIEEDRFDLFPAEVFARGFLRNYARELQVSGDDVMMSYNALRTQRGFSPRPELPPAPQTSSLSSLASSRPGSPTSIAARSLATSSKPMASPSPSSSAILSRLSFARGSDGPSTSSVDSQRTFRFAYLIVFVVVAASLSLSLLFTGTGEAEENQRPARAVPSAQEQANPFLPMPSSPGLSSGVSTSEADRTPPPPPILTTGSGLGLTGSSPSLSPGGLSAPSNLQIHDAAPLLDE